MSIPIILKGDESQAISIKVPEDAAILTITYQGVRRTFSDVCKGGCVPIKFSADETSRFLIGTSPVIAVIQTNDGRIKTVPMTAKIKVTDCPGEVYSSGIELESTGTHGADLSDVVFDPDASQETINDVIAKIVRKFGGTVVRTILMMASLASCAAVQTARFGDLNRNSLVVTNVTDISTGGTAGVDTNAVLGLIAAATNAITPQSIGAQERFGENPPGFLDAGVRYAYAAGIAYSDGRYRPIEDTYAEKYEVEDLHAQVNSLGDHYNEISGTVSAWQTYWAGDDVRVTVTNYYGSMGLPALYIEQKMAADDEHENTWFKIIWDERTRWNEFLAGYAVLTNHVNQDLADRAWGVYDSSTGAYSPDGLLQISQESIMIAAGMAWQKTITTGGGSVWILTSTIPFVMSGETTNGFFRIADGDGHALFEIVKGDKQIVPATPTSLMKFDDGFSVGFSLDSAKYQHPFGEVAMDLNGPFVPEDSLDGLSVTWNGESGNWIATVAATPPHAMPKMMFFRATYETGGNTYIRNNVATSIDKVVVGGIEYEVTVETVNGKKLLVLK